MAITLRLSKAVCLVLVSSRMVGRISSHQRSNFQEDKLKILKPYQQQGGKVKPCKQQGGKDKWQGATTTTVVTQCPYHADDLAPY